MYEPCITFSNGTGTPLIDRCKYTPPDSHFPMGMVPEATRRSLMTRLGEERGRRLLAEGGQRDPLLSSTVGH